LENIGAGVATMGGGEGGGGGGLIDGVAPVIRYYLVRCLP